MAKRDRTASGSAIAGAGGVTAATGLVGGGIPGYKSDSTKLKNLKTGSFRHRAGSALSSGRGGIFGYRTDAHQGALNEFRADAAKHAGDKPSRADSFMRGRGTGKIKPEVDIIRHLKRGRTASTAALGVGAAATAYGVHRAKTPVRKAKRDTDAYHGALLGGGATTAAGSAVGAKVLGHQARKWADRAGRGIDEAAKIVPNTGGRVGPVARVRDTQIHTNKKILAGKSKVQAEAAGKLRGDVAQSKYFANVYGKTAKTIGRARNPALAVAGVGGAGLLLGGKKTKVNKRMSAFGVEH